jgi:transposase-like protein
MMLPAKFGSILPSSFRGEDFFNISQSETSIALGEMYVGGVSTRKVSKIIESMCGTSVSSAME